MINIGDLVLRSDETIESVMMWSRHGRNLPPRPRLTNWKVVSRIKNVTRVHDPVETLDLTGVTASVGIGWGGESGVGRYISYDSTLSSSVRSSTHGVLTLKSGNIPVLKRKEKDKKSDVTLKSLPQVRVYFLVPWGQGRYNKNRREIYKSFCLWWDVCTFQSPEKVDT